MEKWNWATVHTILVPQTRNLIRSDTSAPALITFAEKKHPTPLAVDKLMRPISQSLRWSL